jgi:Rps23 Pro-64 3,4-dihydroxylase Tpa1-like proline 4-hydroxylase
MRVSRPPFSGPILCIDDFLSDQDAQAVLRECLLLRDAYMPAMVFDGTHTTNQNTKVRKNTAVQLNEAFRDRHQQSSILHLIGEKIWTPECRALWHVGHPVFDTINHSTRYEAVLSYYGDGDFYKKHRDTRPDDGAYRVVTLLYYVHRHDVKFSGGSLVLWQDGRPLPLSPKHNRAIVFPSAMLHEVEPVHMDGKDWECGRFSINYWLGFQ